MCIRDRRVVGLGGHRRVGERRGNLAPRGPGAFPVGAAGAGSPHPRPTDDVDSPRRWLMGRGQLRVYLGAAPGVGKTFAMLDEGQRRAGRGTDVVVGYVETHNRPLTAARLADLEVLPRRQLTYRGTSFTEMDVDAVLARRPKVALVDELAHTNVPGSPRPKRWQDVELLLEAGIDVISTVDIQHLESVNDVVEAITGIRQRETVPDSVVRAADQVELRLGGHRRGRGRGATRHRRIPALSPTPRPLSPRSGRR